ncbi:class I SAM-dependent methyltransferase [Pelagibacterium xiamenense]|uniref:class I SAM-dependent methyltransferase n=1 Tax=Pelagibacterium xiamenense TaxID=2901140 RepID=UPI001E622BEC|nr:SAM-dependent methyltransferase [Pelagibacterium xiamenense]MCD7060299.1 SAM-dependent methyltransferase [Pelagibacterium xiamenense]
MPENTFSLGDLIDMQIRQNGPMSLATYMGLCLTHPNRGYYRKADPLGTGGDFITAPEISQTFGEMIGAWIAAMYQQMGAPARFTLLELGPGRGTLAADALRVATRVPGLRDALNLVLYETNPALIALQRETLAPFDPAWIETLDGLPDAPLIVIANEFFDALPVRQFVLRNGKWYERVVGLIEGKRAFGLSPTPYDGSLLGEAFADAREGEVAEIGLAARQAMEQTARLVAPRGGAILAIDYGYEATQPGETLQAVSRHAYADPLAGPGDADLTTHVDFEALGHAARIAGLTTHPLVTQGRFLTSLGLVERHKALAAANPQRAAELQTALDRLTNPAQMGDIFKAFCAASPGLRPPGFPIR